MIIHPKVPFIRTHLASPLSGNMFKCHAGFSDFGAQGGRNGLSVVVAERGEGLGGGEGGEGDDGRELHGGSDDCGEISLS